MSNDPTPLEQWQALPERLRKDPRSDGPAVDLAILLICAWRSTQMRGLPAGKLPPMGRDYATDVLGIQMPAATNIASRAARAWDRETGKELAKAILEQAYANTVSPVTGTVSVQAGEDDQGRPIFRTETGLVKDPRKVDEADPWLYAVDVRSQIAIAKSIRELCGADEPTKTETKLDAADDLKAMLAKSRALPDHPAPRETLAT